MMSRRFFFAAACGLFLLADASWGVVRAADAPVRKTAGSEAVFKALDTDRNGTLSPQEFQAGYVGLQRAIAVEIRLREQFRTVDANHDGAIDAGEYGRLALVGRLGKSVPPLSTFDADRDRKLDFAEYVAAIRRLIALQPVPAAKTAAQN